MIYQIIMHKADGLKRSYASFDESEGVRGDVVVTFKFAESSHDWAVRNANVPLFLSNLRRFLKKINIEKAAVFTAQFSPNANGELRDGFLYFSRTSGSAFDQGIYDETDPINLRLLEAKLAADIEQYGAFSD